MTVFEFFSSWQVGLTAAALFTLTNRVKVALGTTANNVVVQRLLPFTPVFLGGLVGLVPGWFPADTVAARVVCGVLVGACTPMIYGVLKKRLSDETSTGSNLVQSDDSSD